LATKTGSRPSQLLKIDDEWAAYQFDNAVIWFGMTLDALVNETENVGDDEKPHYEPKYSLSDLLDPDYRVKREEEVVDFTALKGIEGVNID